MMHQNIMDREVEEMLACHFRKWFQDFVRILDFLSTYVADNQCYDSQWNLMSNFFLHRC